MLCQSGNCETKVFMGQTALIDHLINFNKPLEKNKSQANRQTCLKPPI